MRQIRVLLIEDQPVMREGLKMLFASSGDVAAVGEVESGEAAVQVLASCTADVVLLDLDLGGMDGFDVIPRIAHAVPGAKLLALTALRDPERHRAVLRAGARGVVTKDKAGEIILNAIRKVASGELWFERRLIERTLLRSILRERGHGPPHEVLTGRESDILALIGEGSKNAEIARRLRISVKTVRNHLTSIFGKVGVSDRLALVVRAQRLGLVAVPRGASPAVLGPSAEDGVAERAARVPRSDRLD